MKLIELFDLVILSRDNPTTKRAVETDRRAVAGISRDVPAAIAALGTLRMNLAAVHEAETPRPANQPTVRHHPSPLLEG